MILRHTVCFGPLLLLSVVSCSRFNPRGLVNLPVSENRDLLDSSQAQIVFNYAQHFPNETQLSICIIAGDSEKYVGIQRRNDSLVYIQNSDSVFEIGSITKTFTGTMLAKLVYDGKIDLNEPIKNILPARLRQSSLDGKEITLVQLANHTSGLPFEPSNVKDDKEHPFDPYSPYRYYLAQKTTKTFDEHFTGGLGWATYSDHGKNHVGAFGGTGGYTSGVIFERNERVGLVVLTNVSVFLASQGNYTEGLCRGLYDPLPFSSKKKR